MITQGMVATSTVRMIITEHSLLRLMHLSSNALPVGAYAFSHGLEYAIEERWLTNVAQIRDWLSLQLQHSVARVDLPIIYRMHAATLDNAEDDLRYWNEFLLACRESAEFQLSDTATGEALQRLLKELDVPLLCVGQRVTFIAGFAQAAAHWQLNERHCAMGYLWSWLENQVGAATKLLPLGQTQAQKLLTELQGGLPGVLDMAGTLRDDELGAGLPALAIASMLHETQYTRLFRS